MLAVFCALLLAPTASAAIWYQTRTNAASNVKARYAGVRSAQCVPPTTLPISVRLDLMPNATYIIRGETIWWTHFLCVVTLKSGRRGTNFVFKQTGPRWDTFRIYSLVGASIDDLHGR